MNTFLALSIFSSLFPKKKYFSFHKIEHGCYCRNSHIHVPLYKLCVHLKKKKFPKQYQHCDVNILTNRKFNKRSTKGEIVSNGKLFDTIQHCSKTVWKFQEFSVNQILCEINYGESKGSKSVVFAIFSLQKVQKFIIKI